jgi:phosphate transport system protein
MSDNHISKKFDLELESLRTRVLQMGGMAEQQVRRAVDGLYEGDTQLLETVIRDDERINRMETEIDMLCNQVIAKRQPTAIDLRMVVSVMKAIADIERVGDKARKIARLGISIANAPTGGPVSVELDHMTETALKMLRLSLDGFARLDLVPVAEAVRLDEQVDAGYRGIARQLITYMMEDPRTITRSLDILTIAKAVERIGDHSTNIAEYVVYMVKGLNVRHATPAEVEAQIRESLR